MKLTTAKTVIKTNINSQIKGKPTQPLVIAGSPGLGKTRTIETITRDLSLGLVHYSVPELTSELLSGLTTLTYA